ncbi:hypothetical protein D3C81_1890840 [compost metagenome]
MLTESINDHSAFGFTYFLYDNLLRGLSGDTVEGHRFNLIFDVTAQLDAWLFILRSFQRDFTRWLSHFIYGDPTAEGIEIASFAVNADANFDFLLVFFLGGGG